MEISYKFTLPDGRENSFVVRLDPETMAYAGTPAGAPPEWTRLENRQCRNCPLKPKDAPHCPVAVNIAPLVDAFKDTISYDEATISVEAPGRSYTRKAPMQAGVSSLFGMVMATSGCPVLDRLRPMVFTHLPFPSLQETLFRSMSTYLLGQFIVSEKGGQPDWSLKGLATLYQEVSKVNADFLERLRALVTHDASINAVVKLDCFAAFTVSTIQKSKLGWLETLFRPYWEKGA